MKHVTLLIDDVLQKALSLELEDKKIACRQIVQLSRNFTPILSMVVAKSRIDNFDVNVDGWVKWCKTFTGLEGSELHHKRAMGDLLLFAKINITKHFDLLFNLDSNKLYAITRIKNNELNAFIAGLPQTLDKLSRDEVRNEVKKYLGEEIKQLHVTPMQMELPGFDEVINQANKLDISTLYNAIGDETKATQSLHLGYKFLGASTAYLKKSKDIEALKAVKNALLQEINELEQAMAECDV